MATAKKNKSATVAGASSAAVTGPSFVTGVALIGALAWIAYYPALRGGFILDDTWLLTGNPLIKASDGLLQFWNIVASHDAWPMTNTTFWVEWRMWGMHPTGYHATNLLLHIGTAAMIWILLQKLTIRGALVAALLFAVHPVNVESVAWISQRKNLLALFFSLVSSLWFLKGEDVARASIVGAKSTFGTWHWLSFAAFLLAMLSKGSVAVLPIVLVGMLAWQRPLTRHDLPHVAPFVAASALLVPLNIWLQQRVIDPIAQPPSLIERLLGAGAIVWFYLYKALLPLNLLFVYPRWSIHADELRWWLPALAWIAATAVLWVYRKTVARPFFYAWAFFCIALAPVLGLTDITFMEHSLVADHYQHIALIGVVALVGAGWDLWCERSATAARIGLVAVLALLVVLTWKQSSLYADSVTLYEATLRQNPDSWMLRNDLCAELADRGHVDAAIEHCEYALRLKPDSASVNNTLGRVLAESGQNDRAIEQLTEALRLRPDMFEARMNLGNIWRDKGDFSAAATQYQEALRINPDSAALHDNWGMALARSGRSEEAVAQFKQALDLDPDSAKAHNNLAITLAQAGHLPEAIVNFREALRLNPNFADAQKNLQVALDLQERNRDASR